MAIMRSALRLALKYEAEYGVDASYEAQDSATVPDLETGLIVKGTTTTSIVVVPGELTSDEEVFVLNRGWTQSVQKYRVRVTTLALAKPDDVLIVGGERRTIVKATQDALGLRWGLLTIGS